METMLDQEFTVRNCTALKSQGSDAGTYVLISVMYSGLKRIELSFELYNIFLNFIVLHTHMRRFCFSLIGSNSGG